MEIIDSEQRARRLARAVATDIVLYNEKQLSAGADLSREIAEGRSHFCARVTPSLHWIYEEVVAGTALGKAVPPSGARAGAVRAEAPPAKVLASPTVREPPRFAPKAQPAMVEHSAARPEQPPPISSAPPAKVTVSGAQPEPSSSVSDTPPARVESSDTPPEASSRASAREAPSSVPNAEPRAAQSRSIKGLVIVLLLCLVGLAAAIGWLGRH